jgi:hypothetical protein
MADVDADGLAENVLQLFSTNLRVLAQHSTRHTTKLNPLLLPLLLLLVLSLAQDGTVYDLATGEGCLAHTTQHSRHAASSLVAVRLFL